MMYSIIVIAITFLIAAIYRTNSTRLNGDARENSDSRSTSPTSFSPPMTVKAQAGLDNHCVLSPYWPGDAEIYCRLLKTQQKIATFYFSPSSYKSDPTWASVFMTIRKTINTESVNYFTLVGFADISGDYKVNIALSRERAKTVANNLFVLRRSITHIKIIGLGEELPQGDYTTTRGDDLSRRVEVFIEKKVTGD